MSLVSSTMTAGMNVQDPGVALFDISEAQLGNKLGSGGFCNVFELKALSVICDTDDRAAELSLNQKAARAAISEKINANPTDETLYAVKLLRPDLDLSRKPMLARAASHDLAKEIRTLSSLSHPNIISIKGAPFSLNDTDNQPFLIMERLDETLTDRLETWKAEATKLKQSRGILSRVLGNRQQKKKQLLVKRLQVASEIAAALEYLHEKRIVYQDLKAGNVGFEAKTGHLKLFDFGLARSLPEKTNECQDTFEMSGKCGTFRYMPPEVVLRLPYNETVDVYSFSHLLWRILKLESPYAGYSKRMHRKYVAHGGQRPPLESSWPKGIQEILQRSWSSNIGERPSMTEIIAVLQQTISDLTGKAFVQEPKRNVVFDTQESMDSTVCSSDDCVAA